MENQTHKELLREFRSAHRLINEFQNKIQELILCYIAPKLNLNSELAAKHLFCDSVHGMESEALGDKAFRITSKNWAWDLLYTHAIEYYLGMKDQFGYAVIQISDSGAYLPKDPKCSMVSSSNFREVECCDSYLIFKIKYQEHTRKGWMHTDDRNTNRIQEILLNESDVLIPENSPNTCYYRVSLLDMMDEDSCERRIEEVKAEFAKFRETVLQR